MGSYLAHGPKIYPKAHENPRVFSCISGPIFLKSYIQFPWGIGLHYSLSPNLCKQAQSVPTNLLESPLAMLTPTLRIIMLASHSMFCFILPNTYFKTFAPSFHLVHLTHSSIAYDFSHHLQSPFSIPLNFLYTP